MTSSSRCIRTVPLLAALLALFGMQAAAETIDELYDKARQEKTLVYYCAGPTGAQDRWIDEFQHRFPGVKVELIGGLIGMNPGIGCRVEPTPELSVEIVEVAQRASEEEVLAKRGRCERLRAGARRSGW